MTNIQRIQMAMPAAACLFLVLLLAPAVPAAEEARLSLAGLIEELAQRNPEIKAARKRWEAAQAIVPQVQTLPDPKLQLGYQRMPMVEPLQG
ncbi:MAG: hypothetical protein AB1411_16860, partial [Nitrospirota bacterium]